MSKKRRLNINLTQSEHRFLYSLAKVQGLSMSKLVRLWIGREGGPYMDDNNNRFKLSRDIKPFPATPDDLCTLITHILREHKRVEDISIKAGKPVTFSFWVDRDNYEVPDLTIYNMLRNYTIDDLTSLCVNKDPIKIVELMIDTIYSSGYEPLCFLVHNLDIWKWAGSSSIVSKRKSVFLGYSVIKETSIGEDRLILAASPKKELGVGSVCYAVQIAVDEGNNARKND